MSSVRTEPFDGAPGRERRRSKRVKTRRAVLFDALRAERLPHQGVAVDLSGEGVQVHTRVPLSAGAGIHVEIAPRNDGPTGRPILARGRVTRVTALGAGDYAMGIQVQFTPRRRPSMTPRPALQVPLEAAGSNPSGVSAPAGPMLRARSRRRVRAGRLAVMTLCALLILLWAWVHQRPSAFSKGRLGLKAASHPAQEAAPQPPPAQPGYIPQAFAAVGPSGRDAVADNPLEDISMATASMAEEATVVGGWDKPASWDEGLRSRTEPPVGPGDDRIAGGNAASPPTDQPLPRPLLRTEVRDAIAATAGDLPGLPVAERVLVVDKGAFRLTMYANGRLIREFPVGVGALSTTPAGLFRIANKLTDPDWYNRGQSIKAGDPSNPLGKRWIGLGLDDVATSYGIHPANQPEAVGRASGRGCIRMRPEDAETVFRLCPIGTPVLIRE